MSDKNQKPKRKFSPLGILGSFFSFKGLLGDIKRGFRISKTVKKDLTPKELVVIGEEDFDTMIERLGLTERDLENKIKLCVIQSRIYGIASLAFFVLMFWWASLPGVFSSVCAMIISGSLWFRWSLRLWRLRQRDLLSHKEFLKSDWYLEWLK